MNDILINVDGVSKKFCKSLRKSLKYGLQDLGHELTGSRHGGNGNLRPDEFWAVNDVSFELRRGESLGLIGRNGAGKTTLLRMLNGLIKPDRGRIEMQGRVGALIALGAGFNPILSGRENIYVNGSVLGLTKKEIDAKLEEIIDFAEIEEFIDSPVQYYSSGMNVRLGFAIASSLNPDILILDEVLAVGDVNFQIKCGQRIRQLSANAAVIFVSHSMQSVSWFCSRVIVLKDGKIIHDARNPADGIGTYFSMIESKKETFGSGEATICDPCMLSETNIRLTENIVLEHGETPKFEFDLIIQSSVKNVKVILSIIDESGNGIVFLPIQDKNNLDTIFHSGKYRLRVSLGRIELNAGKYSFLVAITDAETRIVLLRQEGLCPFRVKGESNTYSKIVRPVSVSFV
ncbi:MAG: ABC transporter ATP-binding protein [Mariniphaga sp.]